MIWLMRDSSVMPSATAASRSACSEVVVWVAGDVGLESVDAGVDDRLGVHQLGDRGFGIVGNLGLHLVLIGLADGVGELLGTRGGGVFGDDGDQVEVT